MDRHGHDGDPKRDMGAVRGAVVKAPATNAKGARFDYGFRRGTFLLKFDSPESFNHEELFGKRHKRLSMRYLIIFAIICACCIGVGIGYFSRQPHSSSSCTPTPSHDSFDFAKFIAENVDKDRIRERLQNYTQEPRLDGTEQDVKLAEIIAYDWKQSGLDEVHLATYDILLSFPRKGDANLVQVVNTTSNQVLFESRADETPLTPHENNSNVVPSFNAYSPAGNVTGTLVYVNYGRIEDFQFLANNLSINLTGMVVVARYGKIFRGDKVRNAEKFHAAAVILYSDPNDYNRNNAAEKPYPDSWWLPETGMQRGTVNAGNGDPQTPLYPSNYYAHRVPEKDVVLPKIPSQPIGYRDAERILKDLGGPVAPDDWQGRLPLRYHIGPGYANGSDIRVRVEVKNYLEVKPVHNVIGYIKGSEEPDRYVLLGNHHDAWVFGSVDPLSGSAALTEITRVFGLMLRNGHRPKRTVVFCSWDAEESGLMGSIEWVEDHLKVLTTRGVAYLNVDWAAEGHYTLLARASPLLQDELYAAAKKVPSPDTSAGVTLYDLWKNRPVSEEKRGLAEPSVGYSLGSGSDMAPFYQRSGVPCVDMWMTFDQIKYPILFYPLYHSSYETFFAFDTYIDPGFTFTKAMAQFWAVMASDLANEELLPFKVERYSEAVKSFLTSLKEQFEERWRTHNVSVDAFQSAATNFSTATRNFQQKLDANKDSLKNSIYRRMINDRLMQLERAFLDTESLPGVTDQKHVMFAPSQYDSYKDNSFPGIVDTMYKIDNEGVDLWDQLKKQVYIATYIIQGAANTLEDIGL